MNDGTLLLDAMQANPHDAHAWLVMADWLDEHVGEGEGYWVRWVGTHRVQPMASESGKTCCWYVDDGMEFPNEWDLLPILFLNLFGVRQRRGKMVFARYHSARAAMWDLYQACRRAKPPKDLK